MRCDGENAGIAAARARPAVNRHATQALRLFLTHCATACEAA